MMKTENYQLNQWEPTDKISRGDFNNDNAKLDAALAASAKALSDYKTANDAVVAKKAEQSALTALEQSTGTALTALTAALGSGGKNARIAWGSYTGTNTYGSNNPTSLTFDFKPLVVWIADSKGSVPPATLVRESPAIGVVQVSTGLLSSASVKVTWNDNGLSWYSTASASVQCNSNGTYYYVAVGE